jgi:hypothetical protein
VRFEALLLSQATAPIDGYLKSVTSAADVCGPSPSWTCLPRRPRTRCGDRESRSEERHDDGYVGDTASGNVSTRSRNAVVGDVVDTRNRA